MKSAPIAVTLLLTSALTGAPGEARSSRPAASTRPPAHYVVLLVIDGGRPSYLQLTRLPHIQSLMQHGTVYDQAWVGQLNSSTPGVHVTFGTGTLPRVNGTPGFQWVDPHTRVKIDVRNLLANLDFENSLRRLPVPSVAARLHRYLPHAVSIAASSTKNYAVMGMSAGATTYELFGKATSRGTIPSFLHSPPPLSSAERGALVVDHPFNGPEKDSWAFRYVLSVVRHVSPRLLMMNLPEFDIAGHWNGTDNTALDTRLIENIDTWLGRLEEAYAARGILDRTDFIITADHGMVNSRPAHTTPIVMEAARRAQAPVALIDTAGGGISLRDPRQAHVFARQLVALKPEHVEAIFYRERSHGQNHFVLASPRSWLLNGHVAGALKDLVDTTAGIHGPDVWMLLHEQYTAHPQNVALRWKGTHGGATWQVQHVPLIMAGPDVRSGLHSPFPARAIDIAPTIERLLGLPAMRRTGVVLADALDSPAAGEVRVQDRVTSRLTADVEALQAQSAADG